MYISAEEIESRVRNLEEMGRPFYLPDIDTDNDERNLKTVIEGLSCIPEEHLTRLLHGVVFIESSKKVSRIIRKEAVRGKHIILLAQDDVTVEDVVHEAIHFLDGHLTPQGFNSQEEKDEFEKMAEHRAIRLSWQFIQEAREAKGAS